MEEERVNSRALISRTRTWKLELEESGESPEVAAAESKPKPLTKTLTTMGIVREKNNIIAVSVRK